MKFAKVKNWADFQHYKDRSPPWIKLHRSFLDDYEFACLPIASKALAPLIWLLAAESRDGAVRIDDEFLAFRLRWTIDDVRAGLTPLIEKGFLIIASEPLAARLQVAVPETETETETETEIEEEREKPPAPSRKRSATDSAVELQTWLDTLEGKDAIPEDDSIFRYAEDCKIPLDYLELSWRVFLRDMRERKTRKRDWRAHYRNAVRRNWYKLWWFDKDGACQLTTSGVQERRAAA